MITENFRQNSRTFISAVLICSVMFCYPARIHAQDSKQELFLVAQKAFDDGFYDVAIRYIDQLIKNHPNSDKIIQANLLLGQCYYFKSQYLKAYDTFNKLLQYPDYKDATLFWLGETYLKGSDYQKAEANYKQLIDLYPDSIYTPQGYYSLGWVYFEQQIFDKAKTTFQQLLKNYPAHQLAEDGAFKIGETEFNSHNYESTAQYFKKFALDFPESTRHAEAYFYIGESYYYLEDYLSAISYYSKAEQISLENKLSLMSKLSLGWSYLKLEKFTLAEEYFNKAMEFAQQKGIVSDDVFLGQANLYTELNKHKEALDAYSQLIENFPKSKRLGEAYLGKANTYYLLKDYKLAIKSYENIINEMSGNLTRQDILEKAYFGLAWANLKAGNIDKSIEIFKTIKDKTDSTTVKISALTQIGDAYQDAENLEKAIEIYDTILKDYEESPYTDYVQYRQGIALLKLGKLESATLSFRTLASNFPKSNYLNDIKYYLAVAYFKKEEWIAAIDHIKLFIEKSEGTNELMAEANYILALSYFNIQNYQLSLETFEKIIKLYPLQSNMVKNSELHVAKCLFKMNNQKDSIKAFHQIITKYPKDDVTQEALIWLGDFYYNSESYDEAKEYYLRLIKNFPGSNKINLVRFELGQLYQIKQEYDKAIEMYKSINDKNGRELLAKSQLAIAEIFSNELKPENAIETYRNIINNSAEFSRDAYVKIAGIHKNMKNHAKAIEEYEKALKTDKALSSITNAELQFSISDTYEQINKTDQAIEEYLKIPYLYEKEKNWVTKAYLRIARIFEDSDKWEESKTTYQKIIKLGVLESKFAQERIDWINTNVLNNESNH